MTDASNGTGRVLVVMAHPDDAEFGAAGTVARWAREGRHVTYLVLTDGNRGSSDPAMTPERLTQIRHAEQRAAALRLGVKDVFFLGYDDGSLQPTLDLRRQITRWIRRCKPDVVVAPDPTRRWTGQRFFNHPDHRAAGDATLDAIMPGADTRLMYPELLEEGLEPHQVREVYLSGSNVPDVWVDITPTIDDKIAALREHRSQVGDWPQMEEVVRERAAEMGKSQSLPFAEGFKYFKLRE
ncbi:MAG TPA: PIG-L deacetylase family protein [Candidatus Limnocylindrales bacterium]|nr:PIG-L deacetylase family protein [Candidatus Limnocylindrales bacterium]